MPFGKARESTRSSAMSRAGIGERPACLGRRPPGRMEKVLLVDEVVLEQPPGEGLALPCTCSSPAGLAFSSRMAAARSPERAVVYTRGSVGVEVDATYLGLSVRGTAPTMGFLQSSPAGTPQ